MRRLLATRQAVAALTACALMAIAFNARAQDIEPRAYSNAPVGVNFLAASYAHTQGGLPDDPSLPITNDNLKTSNAILSYARALGLRGKSGMFQAVVPYTWLTGSADFAGKTVRIVVEGLVQDPHNQEAPATAGSGFGKLLEKIDVAAMRTTRVDAPRRFRFVPRSCVSRSF